MKQLHIAVVGLGLIGGSFCKAITGRTSHHCFGWDLNGEVCEAALRSGAVEGIFDPEGDYSGFDLVLVCLHPKQTVSFILDHADKFGSALVADCCGVKEAVVDAVQPVLQEGNHTLLLERSRMSALTQQMELAEAVDAPVQQGQELGALIVSDGETEVARFPLVAETAVERLTWWDLTLRLLQQAYLAG